MDLNQLLIWTIAVSCGLTIFQVHGQPIERSKRLVSLGLVGLLAVLYVWQHEFAGYIVGGLWGLFIVLPGFVAVLFGNLISHRRFRLAWLSSIILGWLHPFSGNRNLSKLSLALLRLNQGRDDVALPALLKLRSTPGAVGRAAHVIYVRSTNGWQKFLDEIASGTISPDDLREPLFLDAYLQALGEVHRRAEMLAEFQHKMVPLLPQFPAQHVAMTLAKIAAFCGDELLVRQLWNGTPGSSQPGMEQFWIATALQVAGEPQRATAIFEHLVETESSPLASASQRRVDAPLPCLSQAPLTATEGLFLRNVHIAARPVLLDQSFSVQTRPWATWTMALILMLVFLAEIPGGTENYDNLVNMGAMLIPVELNGNDWWRPITAAFLHFGLLHVALNTLGLIVLGQQVERLWGGFRMLIGYLCAAVGSMYFTPWIMSGDGDQELTILVGASGGVMGLIGGLAVQAGIMLWKGRTKAIARAFIILLIVIAMQMLVDQTSENISSEAHILGLAIGASFGVLWNILPWGRSVS